MKCSENICKVRTVQSLFSRLLRLSFQEQKSFIHFCEIKKRKKKMQLFCMVVILFEPC